MTLAGTLLGARSRLAAPALLLASCLAAAVTIAISRSAGAISFATEPLGVAALGGAALSVAVLATRAWSTSRRLAVWLLVLAASIAFYLVSAAWATAAAQSGWALADLAARVWSQAWIVPITVVQVIALLAVDRSLGARRLAMALTATAAVAMVAAVALIDASEPFVGVATIAPPPARGAATVVETIVSTGWLFSLLVVPALLIVRTRRAEAGARASRGLAVGASLLPVLAVLICLALAVIRDPGDIDPSVGSLGFLVAHSAACAGGALLATTAFALTDDSASARSLVRASLTTVLGGYAAAAVIVLGILAASALGGAGVTVTVLAVATAGAAAAVGVRTLSGRLLAFLLPAPPEPPRASVLVDALSPRETEVLEALASGASNAGIAARLVVSERTVDAHLRSVFAKLGLQNDPADNRRVLAARIWFEASQQSRPAR